MRNILKMGIMSHVNLESYNETDEEGERDPQPVSLFNVQSEMICNVFLITK